MLLQIFSDMAIQGHVIEISRIGVLGLQSGDAFSTFVLIHSGVVALTSVHLVQYESRRDTMVDLREPKLRFRIQISGRTNRLNVQRKLGLSSPGK